MQKTEEHSSIKIHTAGRDWVLLRPSDLESLWNSMTEEAFTEDERLPYWVELWPASLALSDWLKSHKDELVGASCLDLGCGLGLTAMVASWLGARVVGVDYEPEALAYARMNAEVNMVSQPCWTVMDWRAPALSKHSCNFIWGGDIMYERRFVAPVLACLEHALAPGGKVWLAEPNRNVYDEFRNALIRRGWSSKKVLCTEVDPLHVQKSRISVTLWELSK